MRVNTPEYSPRSNLGKYLRFFCFFARASALREIEGRPCLYWLEQLTVRPGYPKKNPTNLNSCQRPCPSESVQCLDYLLVRASSDDRGQRSSAKTTDARMPWASDPMSSFAHACSHTGSLITTYFIMTICTFVALRRVPRSTCL